MTGLPMAMMSASRSTATKLVRPGGALAEKTPPGPGPGPGLGPATRTTSLASSCKAAAAASRLSMPGVPHIPQSAPQPGGPHIPQSAPLPALLDKTVGVAFLDSINTASGQEPVHATRTMSLASRCKAAAAAASTAPGLLHVPQSAPQPADVLGRVKAGLPTFAALSSTDSLLLLTASGRREMDRDMSLSHIISL